MGRDPVDLTNVNPQWTERMKGSIPDKIKYGDDWDFFTELAKEGKYLSKSKDHTSKQTKVYWSMKTKLKIQPSKERN